MTTNFNADTWFAHYGIKGMRWGVRKDEQSGGTKSASKTAETLTNKELKKRVDRLNMEKRYVDLMAQKSARNKSNFSKGRDTVLKGVGKLATDVVKEIAKEEAKGLIKDYVKEMSAQTEVIKKAFKK